MAADQRRPTGEHPDPETLLAYHEGALPEAEADRVQEHLVHCEECAQAVLDFAAFPDLEPPSEEHRVTPLELRRRWRDLQAAIARRERPWWQRHHVLLPLAATFFAAAVGLAIWGAGMHERLAELEAPRADVSLATLRPEGVVRGPAEGVEVPDWAREVMVVLAYAEVGARDGGLEVDVATSDGRSVVSGLRVRRHAEGHVAVELPRRLLAPGRYTFELYRRAGGQRRLLERYSMTVVEAPP